MIAGLLGDRLGIMPVLAYQGVGYVVAGAVVLLALRLGPPQAPAVASLASSSGRAG